MLIVKGNKKLGKKIWQFSIPAGSTCPGKSVLCNERCYAQKGMFTLPRVQSGFINREKETKKQSFVSTMIYEILKVNAEIFRIHISGDFYSKEYVDKWYEIIKACRTTKFFTYTRSWRIDNIVPSLIKLSTCNNLRLWYSADHETGYPKNKPKKVRVAYMSVSDLDVPHNNRTSLVFRDYQSRGLVRKRINGVFVCPPENGITHHMTCEKCKMCWGSKEVPKSLADKKIPLSLLAI